MSDPNVQWLAEIACPRCSQRVTVPIVVTGVRIVPKLVTKGRVVSSSLVADFAPAEVSHRCPDPTRDRTGAAR